MDDVLGGLDRCLAGEDRLAAGLSRLGRVFAGLLVGWWVYVPLHELLHAAGCALAGGSVDRIEIAPLYGGHLLARLLPFVEAGGEYAGRLSGFDTGGSDLVYLATDLAPFVLTLPGLRLLLRAGHRGRSLRFGFSLPFALAPFLSLTGDAYEIGSIVVTRLPPWRDQAVVLRGDDLFRVAQTLDVDAWPGFALAVVVGVVWAFATYSAGRWLIGRIAGPCATLSAEDPRP